MPSWAKAWRRRARSARPDLRNSNRPTIEVATKRAMEELTNEQKLYHQAENEAGQRAKQNQDLEREIRQREHVEK